MGMGTLRSASRGSVGSALAVTARYDVGSDGVRGGAIRASRMTCMTMLDHGSRGHGHRCAHAWCWGEVQRAGLELEGLELLWRWGKAGRGCAGRQADENTSSAACFRPLTSVY